MRECTKCGQDHTNNFVWCKPCRSKYDKQRFPKIKKTRSAQVSIRREKLREWIRDYKVTKGCERCGENHAACLVFHHLDPNQKEFNLADMLRFGYSKKRMLSEMRKCSVLCANCHYKEHF